MMVEKIRRLSNWLTKIPLSRAGVSILILCSSCGFITWFLFAFSPSASHTQLFPLDDPTTGTDPHPNRQPPRPFNDSKIALLIEDRPVTHLAPLLLHMISVVPSDWRFVFLGSTESVAFLNNSLSVRMQVRSGKLDLLELPGNFSSKGQEPLSQTLTSVAFWQWLGGKDTWNWEDPYVYEPEEWPNDAGKRRLQVEWVLMFQTDSILCANSRASLDDWLNYDWVGAPWRIKDPYGGNGGLSLRRVSRIIQVLHFQKRRPGFWQLEDLWLIERIGILPGARMANGTMESQFSVEHVWSNEPMGYHLGWSGVRLPGEVWNDPEQRDKILNWCPEIKLILDMRLERECQGGSRGDKSVRDYGVEGRAEWPSLSPW